MKYAPLGFLLWQEMPWQKYFLMKCPKRPLAQIQFLNSSVILELSWLLRQNTFTHPLNNAL